MGRIRFGNGITLGLEIPKEEPQTEVKNSPINVSEIVSEVLSKIELSSPKEVDLNPLKADMAALRANVTSCRDDLVKVQANQHQISILSQKIDTISKLDQPEVKVVTHNKDHSQELFEMGEELLNLKRKCDILEASVKKLCIAGLALLAITLIGILF